MARLLSSYHPHKPFASASSRMQMDEGDQDELKKPRKEPTKHEPSTDAFETIEHEFNNVMSGLESDTKLAPFRLIYEKLFRALKKSIQHEKYLAKKCTELSSEITQNAAKVREALQLSQQDQNAVALMKQDTEKAWVLVEEGKKKDQIISNTVDRLQDEVNKISSQLQEERTLALRQENELQQISQERDSLKTERADFLYQIDQFEKLKHELEIETGGLEAKVEEMDGRNAKMTEELHSRNRELSNAQNKCDGCESEVIGLKAKLGQKTKDYIDVQYSASFAIKKSEQLTKELGEATKKLEKQESACEELSQQTLQLTATLEAQKNKMESINKDFKKNGEE